MQYSEFHNFEYEQIETALRVTQAIVSERSKILSEELLTEIFPIPYSSSEDAINEMSMTLLEKILLPYL